MAMLCRIGSRLSGRSGTLRSEAGLGGDEMPCLVHSFNSAYSDMALPSGIDCVAAWWPRSVAPID